MVQPSIKGNFLRWTVEAVSLVGRGRRVSAQLVGVGACSDVASPGFHPDG